MATNPSSIEPGLPAATAPQPLAKLLVWLPIIAGLAVLYVPSLIDLLTGEVEDYYGHFRVSTDLIELRNLLQCAQLIVRSALQRKESRGLHYTLDYPDLLGVAEDTVLVP